MRIESTDDYADLLKHDAYSPKELADLTGRSYDFICEQALTGRLKARIVDHQVILIDRGDAIAWLEQL